MTLGQLVKPTCIALALLGGGSGAAACPLCHTEAGEQVRAGIFDGSFVYNLLLTLAAFPALGLPILALRHLAGPAGASRHRTGEED